MIEGKRLKLSNQVETKQEFKEQCKYIFSMIKHTLLFAQFDTIEQFILQLMLH